MKLFLLWHTSLYLIASLVNRTIFSFRILKICLEWPEIIFFFILGTPVIKEDEEEDN